MPPETKLVDEDAFYELLATYSPDHTDAWVEVLSEDKAWGYTSGPKSGLRAFNASYGQSRRWTISPVYANPNVLV